VGDGEVPLIALACWSLVNSDGCKATVDRQKEQIEESTVEYSQNGD